MKRLNSLQWATKTDVLSIRGLFETPGLLPMISHLHQLGEAHETRFESFWERHKHSTFQVRLAIQVPLLLIHLRKTEHL